MRYSLLTLASASLATLSSVSAAPLPTCEPALDISSSMGPKPRVKVGSNTEYPCPYGWTRSFLDTGLCIEIVVIGAPAAFSDPASYEPAHPGEPIVQKKKHSQKPKHRPIYGPGLSHPIDHIGPEPQCPAGKIGGTEDEIEICFDAEGDAFTLHGDIKIGFGSAPNSKNPSGTIHVKKPKHHSPTKVKEASPPHKVHDTQMPPCGNDDPRALLNLCISIGGSNGNDPSLGGVSTSNNGDGSNVDNGGDPFSAGGIKIGKAGPSASAKPKHKSKDANKPKKATTDENMPPCSQNDPRALLNLCINLGGSSPSNDGQTQNDGSFFGPGGIKIGKGKDSSSTGTKKIAADNNLPPCSQNDPRALLNLCIDLGGLLGNGGDNNGNGVDNGSLFGPGGIKIGKGKDKSGGNPKKASVNDQLPPCSLNDPRALLNLCIDLGGLLGNGDNNGGDNGGFFGPGGIKIGKQATSTKSAKGSKATDYNPDLLDANASVGQKGIKADAALAGLPLVDASIDNNGINADVLPSVGGILGLDVPGVLNAKVGGGKASKANSKAVTKAEKTSASLDTSSDCQNGEILRGGLCVVADVKVGKVAHIKGDLNL